MRGLIEDGIFRNPMVRAALRLQNDAATLGGNVTLVDQDQIISAWDAGGSSRNVTLPVRAEGNDGTIRLIVNLSTAGENLVIKNSAATTLLTLPSSGVALVIATGTAEAPGTRAWIAVPIGGEDLALADDLAVTGDVTVTGNTTLNGKVQVGNAVTDSVGFYSTAKVSQPRGASQAAVTTLTGGKTTTNVAARLNTLIKYDMKVRTDLIALGLIKGAA